MRDITMCHPCLQELAGRLVEECKKQGLIIKIGECYRTVAEQEELYAQGRKKPGNIVTNARGSSYSSQHQWALRLTSSGTTGMEHTMSPAISSGRLGPSVRSWDLAGVETGTALWISHIYTCRIGAVPRHSSGSNMARRTWFRPRNQKIGLLTVKICL